MSLDWGRVGTAAPVVQGATAQESCSSPDWRHGQCQGQRRGGCHQRATAAPFQNAPDPARGALGAVEHGTGAVMGVVGAPFQLLDTGFAVLTAPLAVLLPGFPAATLGMPHFGPPHTHAHPLSLTPPNPVPVPLPSIGRVMLAGCVSGLIGGIPAARAGDVGLAPTCFGLAPAFDIFTGSSNTWIGGSRAARMTDITWQCQPASAMNRVGKVMGGIGVAAGAISAGASATEGAYLKAAMQAAQAAADAAALAMSSLLGKDPAFLPPLGPSCWATPRCSSAAFRCRTCWRSSAGC
ncbi:PAAR domain-containing protein [Myxococcota bacterium]